jgi:hypothetical protein
MAIGPSLIYANTANLTHRRQWSVLRKQSLRRSADSITLVSRLCKRESMLSGRDAQSTATYMRGFERCSLGHAESVQLEGIKIFLRCTDGTQSCRTRLLRHQSECLKRSSALRGSRHWRKQVGLPGSTLRLESGRVMSGPIGSPCRTPCAVQSTFDRPYHRLNPAHAADTKLVWQLRGLGG